MLALSLFLKTLALSLLKTLALSLFSKTLLLSFFLKTLALSLFSKTLLLSFLLKTLLLSFLSQSLALSFLFKSLLLSLFNTLLLFLLTLTLFFLLPLPFLFFRINTRLLLIPIRSILLNRGYCNSWRHFTSVLGSRNSIFSLNWKLLHVLFFSLNVKYLRTHLRNPSKTLENTLPTDDTPTQVQTLLPQMQ